MSEIIEQAGKKAYEIEGLAVWLANDAVGGNVWKNKHVEVVQEIGQKLRLLRMILSGQTTAENSGLQK